MVYHKLARILGVFNDLENKFKYAIDIFQVYLQAMENHPVVLSTVGVSNIHST